MTSSNESGSSTRAPALVCAAVLCLFATPAHAYIDPGIGAMLIQSLIAGVAMAAAFWRRIRDFIFRRGSPAPRDPAATKDGG